MPESGTRRSVVWTAVIVVLVLAALFGAKIWKDRRAQAAHAHHGAFAVSVSVAKVETASWQREIHAVANLVAVKGAHLVPQLPGQVTGIYFHSGQYVHEGDRLVQLDNSNQLAELASDRAAEKLAKLNFDRAQHLYAVHATSEEALEQARAAYDSAQAAIGNVQATLAKLSVRAPFSGWIGVRQISVGQYLSPSTEIAALNVWDPLRAEFTVPQDQISLIDAGQTVRIDVNAFPGRDFPAKVAALGSEVDPGSRNLTVQATLPNPDHLLRPGMFGDAELLVGKPHATLTVPSTAISYNTFGDFVYVIESHGSAGHDAKVAVATPVKVGETRDDVTEIESGLKAGQEVVTAGQVKLHDGATVTVVKNGPG
jgi:membrane fusion protein, multidrug efflux system